MSLSLDFLNLKDIEHDVDQLYRYEEIVTENPNLFGQTLFNSSFFTSIELKRFRVLKRTPKGAWIEYFCYKYNPDTGESVDKRFVLLTARKRYACNTKEEALLSFIARKKKQIRILESKLEIVRDALSLACHIRDTNAKL